MKKIFSILLAAIMLVSTTAIASTAFAKNYDYPGGTAYTGWYEFDGVWRHFTKGMLDTGLKTYSGKTFYLNPKGFTSGGVYYNKGEVLRGWQKISGHWYYFKPYGSGYNDPRKGWGAAYKNAEYKIGNDYYLFNANGVMLTGLRKVDGDYYLYQSSGKLLRNGWGKYNKKWYYSYNKYGNLYANGTHKIDGKNYKFKNYVCTNK